MTFLLLLGVSLVMATVLEAGQMLRITWRALRFVQKESY